MEGRGPGRETKTNARPLALEGQAASSSSNSNDNGNGKGVGEDDSNLAFIEGLSLLKRDALLYAITQDGKEEWEKLEFVKHLEGAGLQGRELERAQGVIPMKEAAN